MSINTSLNRLLKQAGSFPLDKDYLQEVSNLYAKTLTKVNNELAKVYLKYGDGVAIEELYQYNRLTNLKKTIENLLKDAQRKAKVITKQAINFGFTEQHSLNGFAYNEVYKGANVNLAWGSLDENLALATVKNPKDKISGYIFKQLGENGKWHWESSLERSHAKAFRVINAKINEGLISGQGYAKTAREIRKSILGKKKYQNNMVRSMQRIVRTESQKARSLAESLAFDDLVSGTSKSGITPIKFWLATFDDRTRPSHIDLHNVDADKNGNWTLEGYETGGPLLSGIAGLDINCRCTTGTRVEGLKSTYDESKVAKKLTPDNYRIWKRNNLTRKKAV